MTIFKEHHQHKLLAERMRPTLQTIQYLVGPARKIWEKDIHFWITKCKYHGIFWGPPGCGKTTISKLLAESCKIPYESLSAVNDGVKEIRQAIELCRGGILFIDEIHRLTKSQQDILLPVLESCDVWLIGSTTEAPNTSLNAAILSRVRTIYVGPLKENDIIESLSRSLQFLQDEGHEQLDLPYLEKEAISKIAKMSGNDLRFALNLFENIAFCHTNSEREHVYKNILKHFSEKNHYDLISALIKSMRGSDPDAALFYAFLLLDKGEDPRFILRRCIIFASEDVGNADPQALSLALNCLQAVETVGMPEGRIALAQCITYLSATAKSNRAYRAIDVVRDWIQFAKENGKSTQPPIALTIKGRHEYKYPHDYDNNFIHYIYLPEEIDKLKKAYKKNAYQPSSEGSEKKLLERLRNLWK